ncbi:hypothetical protein J7W19_28675 [Streptomyces mobaraensis NBRC 13819 = DSM 40847]|uniref:hypothetical protein n=1 Tax=Streptomyces mobaraensis TaxID=35621 RepID=UPI00034764DA|nr:hypothetical protein [Streptomyces mobaraensis]QTT76822.1 hypothetical protein J7W19_28675 [Streptomyces mobaraensis NBRC 13819 = DSM 40847]
MLSRPRGLFFWLVVIILLFLIATAPVATAHTILAVWRSIVTLFTGLKIFISVLSARP